MPSKRSWSGKWKQGWSLGKMDLPCCTVIYVYLIFMPTQNSLFLGPDLSPAFDPPYWVFILITSQ